MIDLIPHDTVKLAYAHKLFTRMHVRTGSKGSPKAGHLCDVIYAELERRAAQAVADLDREDFLARDRAAMQA